MPLKGRRIVYGDRKLGRRFRTIQAGVPRLVSKELLGNFLVRRMKERFDRQVDPDGVKWPARMESTKNKNPRLLVETGNLRNSIDVLKRGEGLTSQTGLGFSIGVVSKPRVIVGRHGRMRVVDPAEYGKFHQFGTSKMQRRRFLGIGRLDIKAVDSLLRRELKKLVHG